MNENYVFKKYCSHPIKGGVFIYFLISLATKPGELLMRLALSEN